MNCIILIKNIINKSWLEQNICMYVCIYKTIILFIVYDKG